MFGSLNMKRHRFFGYGNIFGAGSGAGCFGKVNWSAFPKHIIFALDDSFNIRLKFLVINDWYMFF